MYLASALGLAICPRIQTVMNQSWSRCSASSQRPATRLTALRHTNALLIIFESRKPIPRVLAHHHYFGLLSQQRPEALVHIPSASAPVTSGPSDGRLPGCPLRHAPRGAGGTATAGHLPGTVVPFVRHRLATLTSHSPAGVSRRAWGDAQVLHLLRSDLAARRRARSLHGSGDRDGRRGGRTAQPAVGGHRAEPSVRSDGGSADRAAAGQAHNNERRN